MFDPRTVREVIPTAVDLNPLKFYSLIDLAKSASNQDELEALDKLIQDMHVLCEQADHGLDLGRTFPPMSYVYLFYRVAPGHVFCAVVEPIQDEITTGSP